MKTMIHVSGSPLVWTLFVLIAYFSSDIIDKGVILNHLTPYPVLGWMMWGGIVLVIWVLLLQPVIQFYRMRCPRDISREARAKAALHFLQRYKNETRTNANAELYWDISNILNRPVLPGSEDAKKYAQELDMLLARYHEESNVGREARLLILKYSQFAGLGVVFSRNHLMDGIIMLVLQMKLVVALARLYGYKPSPVFNTLCFGWVIGNSLVSALLSQDAAELAGDTTVSFFTDHMAEMFSGEDEAASMVADGLGTRFLSGTVSSLLEAIMSGASVYVTGYIFMRKLENDGHKLTFKELIILRRKARLELGKTLVTQLPLKWCQKLAGGAVKGVRNLLKGISGEIVKE